MLVSFLIFLSKPNYGINHRCMERFRETFSNPHVVLPVIHVETPRQTLKNAEIAQKAGADGAFLISMQGMSHKELSEMHRVVQNEFSTWWVGVNYLDLSTIEVFNTINDNISGVWADDARINEWVEQQVEAEEIKKLQHARGWNGLYFGGVAFKYQRDVDNIELAAQIATHYMDVVTTSGSGTGSAPDREKIARMKGAIGTHPLGIASGITPSNVSEYKEVADCFLVATSLLVPGREEFDPGKVKDLVDAVRN